MSNLEEGVKGIGMLKQNAQINWMTEFNELLKVEVKTPWEILQAGNDEKEWENIPFIIPKSVVLLEKRLTKVQGWAKTRDADIETLLRGEFMEQIRLEMKGDKAKEVAYREKVDSRFDKNEEQLRELYGFEKKRVAKENEEIDSLDFFDQFFSTTVFDEEFEQNRYAQKIQPDQKPDYEKLRKFSYAQIRHIFWKLFNRNPMYPKIDDLYRRVESIDRKIEELKEKDRDLDKKIFLEKSDLRKDLSAQIEGLHEKINKDIIDRIQGNEDVLNQAWETIEEMKAEAEENKAFRENLIAKVDAITKKTNTFTSYFDGKINQIIDDIKQLNQKTDQRLDDFENTFNENVQKIIEEFDRDSGKAKEAFMKQMDDYQSENKEFLEKFGNNITKNVNVLSFETKRALESYKDNLDRNIEKFNQNFGNVDGKLQNYIDRFETYSKTKIEPAYINQAKISLLESRLDEQEDFTSKSSLFIRDIVKRLVFAIQKQNMGKLKKEEEEIQNITKSEHMSTFYITGVPEANLNKENERGDNQEGGTNYGGPQSQIILPQASQKEVPSNKRPHSVGVQKESQTKFNPYDQFGLRNNVNASRFKNSKNKFVPFQVDGNPITQKLPPKSANTELNPRESGAFHHMANHSDAFTNLRDTFYKYMKDKSSGQFDQLFHKRLEALRKALTEEEKVIPIIINDQPTQKGDHIKNFKDLPLVKVTNKGVSRRGQRKQQVPSLNKTFSEFGDGHLYMRSPKEESLPQPNTGAGYMSSIMMNQSDLEDPIKETIKQEDSPQ